MAATRRGASLIAAAAVALLPAGGAWAGFNPGGPSVRVVANDRVEIRWVADFVGDGIVRVFDNPDGTGPPVYVGSNSISANDHRVEVLVGGVVQPDTTYYFKVTQSDPAGVRVDLTNEPAPFPSFFTGAQAIGDVSVVPGTDSAVVSWDANVIGFGRVEILSPGGLGPFGDSLNVTGHSIELTGLSPGNTYQFRVSNRHAIDGGSLVEKTGSFTTLSTLTGRYLQPLTQSTDPVNPVLNTGKNGKVIPVKLQLSQGGTAISDLNAPGPVTIAVSNLASCSITGGDPVLAYADAGQSSAGTNQFRYDPFAQAWIYNLDTKALGLVTGNCYRLDVSINGTRITNAFAAFQPST